MVTSAVTTFKNGDKWSDGLNKMVTRALWPLQDGGKCGYDLINMVTSPFFTFPTEESARDLNSTTHFRILPRFKIIGSYKISYRNN
jgi:hypothetical protein